MPRSVALLTQAMTFGLLTVRSYHGRDRHGHQLYECDCECGNKSIADRTGLLRGKRISCGCRRAVTVHDISFRHGKSHTSEYWAFYTARKRCSDPLHKDFKNYGGRGIEFRFDTFDAWFAELGPKPSQHHSVDRKDNDGHYEVGNVRWATADEQAINKRPKTMAAAA